MVELLPRFDEDLDACDEPGTHPSPTLLTSTLLIFPLLLKSLMSRTYLKIELAVESGKKLRVILP